MGFVAERPFCVYDHISPASHFKMGDTNGVPSPSLTPTLSFSLSLFLSLSLSFSIFLSLSLSLPLSLNEQTNGSFDLS